MSWYLGMWNVARGGGTGTNEVGWCVGSFSAFCGIAEFVCANVAALEESRTDHNAEYWKWVAFWMMA
jgi:hypothetical protein